MGNLETPGALFRADRFLVLVRVRSRPDPSLVSNLNRFALDFVPESLALMSVVRFHVGIETS